MPPTCRHRAWLCGVSKLRHVVCGHAVVFSHVPWCWSVGRSVRRAAACDAVAMGVTGWTVPAPPGPYKEEGGAGGTRRRGAPSIRRRLALTPESRQWAAAGAVGPPTPRQRRGPRPKARQAHAAIPRAARARPVCGLALWLRVRAGWAAHDTSCCALPQPHL